ncbi:MAG: LamG-like jellyroll fold domain-containing protein, partial [Solirubrobacterales bacterium]
TSSLILLAAWPAMAIPEGLVMYWSFDEGQGAVVKDRSGNGNDGTLEGGVVWTAGMLRSALDFNGTNAVVNGPHIPFDNRSFTHAMWVNPSLSGGSQSIFSQYQASSASQALHYRIGDGGTLRMGFYSNDLDLAAGTLQANTWYHLTFRYDLKTQTRKVYVNGKVAGEGTATAYAGTAGNTLVGTFRRPDRADRVPEWFNGLIDDVQVYDAALTDAEIQEIMLGLSDPALAFDPIPATDSVDLPTDTGMSWSAGKSAVTHDVYFGTVLDDVNNASRADPRGVLVSQDQTTTEYVPANPLEFGTTYYWRIDEITAAPDSKITKGELWTFNIEPYAFPITGVTATASSAQPDMGPENTVNGSGLDSLDQHSVEPTTMWLTTGERPAWIQFEFDAVYLLHELWVWNSNQAIEDFMGFGAKTVTIEYSVDGQVWTTLEGVPEFAKAPGVSTYTANTTVAFNDVAAKYVKLTIDASWSDVATATGLSEVRFFYLPVQAYKPDPADGATAVSINTDLGWRPGRLASSHAVSISTDENAVAGGTAPSQMVAQHSFTPGALDFATQYFWKVDEAGDVWSFTTEEFGVVDDFEGYNDDIDAGTTVWQAWVDGVTSKASGSQVGYTESPFAEQSIVHGGRQSMPMAYDNSKSPYYSEAERAFDEPQDLTAGGADSLRLYVRGNAANSAQAMYVTLADSASHTATVQGANAAVVQTTEWQEWRIALSEFGGVNPAKIKKMTIGVGTKAAPAAGGTGTIYVDDIGFGRPIVAQ